MISLFAFRTQLFIPVMLLFCAACSKPRSSPDGFQVEQGFTLTRVASEPLIKDPVDVEFNELGDALVLEMPGYPFEDKQSRIVVLRDNNGDGTYDDRIVFAENLQLASSFMPYKKGMLVAAPPYLLFVHDDDQNYQPEKIDTLMGGFSTGNLQHNYNGLTFGMDNWIYAANGGNDGSPYWWNDTTTRVDLRGQDFRFNIETKTVERLGESSGGFGLAMDEYGRVFETHNLTHISHLVFSDRYVQGRQLLMEHSLENISDHEENGLARIYPIGEQESRVNHPEQSGYFSGSCGVTYYGGGAFGEEYNNTVWEADVVLNLIHVDKIQPNGSSFTASRTMQKRDFLASSDRSFRPVNMTVGPDGALYVVDMYRKVIEHPEWIPDDIEKTLDLNAGKDQGRIYRVAKSGVKNQFDVSQFKAAAGLVNNLSHSNQWVRKTAHRLLLEESLSTETIDLLKAQLNTNHELAKLHSLWILNTNSSLDNGILLASLRDPSPNIRESALVMAEPMLRTTPELVNAAIALLTDADNRVRMQAALSLSTLPKEKFDEIKSPLFAAIRKSASLTGDSWNIAAITLAVGDHSAELLATLLKTAEPVPDQLLNSLALSAAKTETGLQSVLSALANSIISTGVKASIIQKLSSGIGSVNGKSIESFFFALEKSNDLELITALAALRQKSKLAPSAQFLKFSREALSKILDKSLPDSLRLQELAIVELLPYKEKSTVLFACLNHAEPLKLQENALRQLSQYNEKDIGQKIVSMWNELSPQIRRYASDLLLYNENHHDALLTGLEKGTINIGEMNFDLERRRTLLWWANSEETKRRAEKLFSDSGVSNRQEAIDKMKPALALQGSATNGARVFETVCANCHLYGTQGKEVGPVLTEIGRKSKETLMHDILDPNAAADPQYISHRLETTAGLVHIGIVANETDQHLTIKKMGGENVTIRKTDIKTFRSLGSSLMMEGLENSMTNQEMADLLVFLQNGVQ
jgi:putative membrane-bound dehydrogenase-like protein